MTTIKLERVNNHINRCMICDIDLAGLYYNLHIEYSRGGFTTSRLRQLCKDCADSLYNTLGGAYID